MWMRRVLLRACRVRRLSDSAGLLDRWEGLVSRGRLRRDDAQVPILSSLDKLERVLSSMDEDDERVPKGMYVYGEVGTGKSMCMDMFFDSVKTSKRRIHFHELMMEMDRATKKAGGARTALERVGRELAATTSVLCVDEFQVIDGAVAMFLKAYFEGLWERGGVLVATSNRSPSSLYRDGVNYQYFEPFVHRLMRQCKVMEIQSDVDHRMVYRQENLVGARHAWFRVNRGWSKEAIRRVFGAKDDDVTWSRNVKVTIGKSRKIRVPLVAKFPETKKTAAAFSFSDLCDFSSSMFPSARRREGTSYMGASDYTAIASKFNAVAIRDIPVLDSADHDRARRFITLIDCLYENRVVVLLNTHADPTELFLDRDDEKQQDLVSIRELGWAFRRASSRLVEMVNPRWPRTAQLYFEDDQIRSSL